MADSIKLTILSPERRLLDAADVTMVTLTGSEGQIQILPGHAPMIGTLETGVFSYRAETGGETVGVISNGFFEVKGQGITLMADTIELRQEIDVLRAKAAQQKAEAVLQEADLDEHRFNKYQLKLQRALIRQQVAHAGHA